MQRYKKILDFYSFYAYLTLALTHFVLRVLLVDNEQAALTTDNLTVRGTLLQ